SQQSTNQTAEAAFQPPNARASDYLQNGQTQFSISDISHTSLRPSRQLGAGRQMCDRVVQLICP
ncbi:hypothetical protein, partial [Bradyrhizobium sp. Bra78]|uniref:hypothetical protein n=1 Tax=Bradyrhizobium sp. Bra78 TaxID=2926010 RepID=UPI0021C8C453